MKRKAELLLQKKAEKLTKEEQTELEDLALYLVSVDTLVKEREAAMKEAAMKEAAMKEAAMKEATMKEATKKASGFKPAPGEENTAVLKLTKGRRFNPETGEREAPTFTQKFSASEYQLFMANYKNLGYNIEEVVYNPFEK